MSETKGTLDGVTWWPNWYVTRLHAVVNVPAGASSGGALCGACRVGGDVTSEWRARRMAKNPARCTRCEARLAALTSETPAPEKED